ncbi:putative acyl-[acyl-carrier-protein]--UDP-N-acetylglucosamine O-acyltransferase [Arachis hypogaea]|nr:putative acyl-[acyl-carrier-protein]--UDP-N-acetylglucosamine O-acyltransferase [Arachis hypogaea]
MALLLAPHPHTALLRQATPPPRLCYTAPPPQLCYFAMTLQLSYVAPPPRPALLLFSASPLLIKVVKGKILNSSTLNVLYEVDGHWDRTIKVKDTNNRKARVIYDAKEVINGLQAPIVKDAEKQKTSSEKSNTKGKAASKRTNREAVKSFSEGSSFGNCFGASNWFRGSDDSDTAEKPRERGETIIHQFCHLGSFSFLGGGSVVSQNVRKYTMVARERAELRGLNLVGLTRRGFSIAEIKNLKAVYRKIFMRADANAGSFEDRLTEVVASFPFDDHNCPPLQLIISFCHSAYSWLKLDIENVVVVHCKARMART